VAYFRPNLFHCGDGFDARHRQRIRPDGKYIAQSGISAVLRRKEVLICSGPILRVAFAATPSAERRVRREQRAADADAARALSNSMSAVRRFNECGEFSDRPDADAMTAARVRSPFGSNQRGE
jgi:hypothetical protein